MNNHFEKEEDHLKMFLNPEMIENAPDGFTEKIMDVISVEKESLMSAKNLREKSIVPYISAAVTIVLVILTVLLPFDKQDSSGFLIPDIFKNFKISLPEIDLTSVFTFDIPVLFGYILTGVLILSLFDRALYGLFHKRNKHLV